MKGFIGDSCIKVEHLEVLRDTDMKFSMKENNFDVGAGQGG